MQLIDSHCHLNYPDYANDREEIIQRAQQAGVNLMLSICTDLNEAAEVVGIANAYPFIYASVGIHPDHCTADHPDMTDTLAQKLMSWAQQNPKVIGFGETGLDYYRTTDYKAQQHLSFRAHMAAAVACDLPVIVHSRAADEDTVAMLSENPQVRGVIHCFTGTAEMARACLDLGFYISISGIVTFKNARELQEIARWLPLDRILIETDAPFLAPMPYRGKRNEPAYVAHTAAYIAELRGISPEEIAQQTSQNFYTLFTQASRQ